MSRSRTTVTRWGGAAFGLVLVALLSGSAAAEHGTPGTTQVISRPTGAAAPVPPGGVGYAYLYSTHSVSADGRYVVFASTSDSLSTEDDDRTSNVYVRDVQTGLTTLVSRANGPSGAAGHGPSGAPAISADGSRVVFLTTNGFDPLDTNGAEDVYVRDLATGATILVSRKGGAPDAVGDKPSSDASIDADGRRVAFTTTADNFTPADTNNDQDVYLHDLTANTTTLISRATGPSGAIGNGRSYGPSISDAGTRVAFASGATTLVAGVTVAPQVYLRDLTVFPQTTTVVSRSSGGVIGASPSDDPSISGDGKKIGFDGATAFDSTADTNTGGDVYVRDLLASTTTLVSRADGAGPVGNSFSLGPSLSSDGTKVAFYSRATNFTSADTNNKVDVFLRDVTGGTTKLVSRADTASGAIGDGDSLSASVNGDGTKVAFFGDSVNFGGSPGSDFDQVYLRNLTASTTVLASRPSGLAPFVADVNGSRFYNPLGGKVSADGRFVVFESAADYLSDADDNRYSNIFVRDTLTDTTILVNRADGPNGVGANKFSGDETISADGTRVAFTSSATNLVPGDTNNNDDVFVRNLVTGTTTRIDAGTAGAFKPSLSADGTKVAFGTETALDPADTNTLEDVYVRDLTAGTTTLASRSDGPAGAAGSGISDDPLLSADGTKIAFWSQSQFDPAATQPEIYVRDLTAGSTVLASRGDGPAGPPASSPVYDPALSADGTTVAFDTDAANLVSGDVNGKNDVFVRNLAAKTTTLVSHADSGAPGNRGSYDPALSGDGRKIAFDSSASSLVPGDTNEATDIFVRDLGTGTLALVSRAADGSPADRQSDYPSISGNGDCVVFESDAGNLTPSAPPSDYRRVFMRTLARECPVDPPDTTIASGPPALTKNKTPAFTFTSNDPGATFQCSLDGGAFAACAASFKTPPVKDGNHTLTVRAVDPAGYLDASPATRAWTTDATPPRIAVTVPRQRLRTVRARGLLVTVRCNERCTVGATLFRGRKAIGIGTVKLPAAGRKAFRVKLTRKAKRALKHRRSVRLKLRTTAVDQVGNRSRANVRALRLRR